jgi:hypothetical protein
MNVKAMLAVPAYGLACYLLGMFVGYIMPH